MKYIKKDLGSYGLHLIQTNKLKTITIRVVFHTPIIKEEITKRSILTDILLQSTEKYESRRTMTIKAEDLYSIDLATNNNRFGNYIFTSFHMQVLNDKYTEEGNMEKAIAFLSEIIFHPDIRKNAFNKDKLDIAKYNKVVNINSIKEHPSSYSTIRMLEAYDKDSPISYRMMGYMEDLEKINEKNLCDAYQKMIDNDYVDVFVVGEYDTKEMISLIKKYFKFKTVKKRKETYFLKNKKARRRRLIANETIQNTQSKLSIACPIDKVTPYERDYPLVLANIILGGGPDSALFQEVREKKSLCYGINSSLHKLDNILVIKAGIDRKNYRQTVDLITKIIDNLKKGRFTDKEIENAKEIYHTSLEEIEESDNRMIGEVLSSEILKQDLLEGRWEKMQSVKKKDIVKAFKKIHMDTIFLLEGIKDEED